jgi:hypothetical protein
MSGIIKDRRAFLKRTVAALGVFAALEVVPQPVFAETACACQTSRRTSEKSLEFTLIAL